MKATTVRVIGVFLLMVLISGYLFAQKGDEKVHYRQISVEDYKDKIEGAWLGQAIAAMWGFPTESKWQGEIVPFDLEDWYRQITPAESVPAGVTEQERRKIPPSAISEKAASMKDPRERKKFLMQYFNNKNNYEKWTPREMGDQDDIYMEFMFLSSITRHGLDITSAQFAEDWLKYLNPNRIWGANKGAYNNFRKGIWPPESGSPRFNEYWDGIDFQIESDLFGLISPGMPVISNAWCDKVGHLMNYGDGVYAGMAVAAMYTEAFFESNPRKLAEYSLKAIPAESGYAKMVRDVLDFHQMYPNWQDAWKELEKKWGVKDGKLVSPIDVKINGAYIYMGLLYGEGDFWKSMNISMRCGRDSDCNPSNAAGIIGTIIGMKNIPPKWAVVRNLPIENRAINVIYPNPIEWDQILNSTVEVGKWNIIQNGGYLENGVFYIPSQSPVSTPLERNIWTGNNQ
ncbi:ADP-ribosylglycohydrolase family protein [Mariniphaga sediminis]|uniref:ADP-ribosylglycohydrolase family protein n=1 Tax=Mariniphaga sediminis TaxID=1628158 RepID=UPI003567A07F